MSLSFLMFGDDCPCPPAPYFLHVRDIVESIVTVRQYRDNVQDAVTVHTRPSDERTQRKSNPLIFAVVELSVERHMENESSSFDE